MNFRYGVYILGDDIIIGSAMTVDVALELTKTLSKNENWCGLVMVCKDRRHTPSFRAFAHSGKLDFGRLCKFCKGQVQLQIPNAPKGHTRLCDECSGIGFVPAKWDAGVKDD